MADFLIPVSYNGISSWAAHQRRIPKSSEPGSDLYCPIGTPVYAPESGLIYGYGTSIVPATGRWVGINFTNGMSWRALHMSKLERTSGFVRRGDLLGYSGATGYGKEDWSKDPDKGGAHVHVTLWPTTDRRFGYNRNGKPYTIDFMEHVGGSPSGGSSSGGGTVPLPIQKKDEEMTPIWNVVAKIGDKPDSGEIWFGQDNGSVQKLVGYSRGLVSVAFFGAKSGSEDLIPTIARAGGDWDKVVALWKNMKR